MHDYSLVQVVLVYLCFVVLEMGEENGNNIALNFRIRIEGFVLLCIYNGIYF